MLGALNYIGFDNCGLSVKPAILAMALLVNCLKKYGYAYTGRPKDLAVKIEDIAKLFSAKISFRHSLSLRPS